jgi:hypothetical protein
MEEEKKEEYSSVGERATKVVHAEKIESADKKII